MGTNKTIINLTEQTTVGDFVMVLLVILKSLKL